MGHRYVRKSNGLYAVWSTIEDDWLADDLTIDQLKFYDLVQNIKKAIDDHVIFFKKGKFEEYLKRDKSNYDDLEELRKLNH